MFCSNCGKKLSEGDKFCAECGTPVNAAILQAEEEVAQKHNTGDIASNYKVHEIPTDEQVKMEDAYNVWAEEDSAKQEEKTKPLSLDWSSVIDEPRKKRAPDIGSPWDEDVENEYVAPESPEMPELDVDFGDPSKDRSRTMTFIDILKQEKEERRRSESSKGFSDLIAEEQKAEDIIPSGELEKTQGYTDLKQDIIAELSKDESEEKETPDFDSQFDYIKMESEPEDVDLFNDVDLDKIPDDGKADLEPEDTYSDYEDAYDPGRRSRFVRAKEYDEAEELEESALNDASDDEDVVESSSDILIDDQEVELAEEYSYEDPSIDDEIKELERQLAELMSKRDEIKDSQIDAEEELVKQDLDEQETNQQKFDIESLEDLSSFEDLEHDDYDIDEVIKELGEFENDIPETYGEASFGPIDKPEEEIIEEGEEKVEEFDDMLKENPKADISQLIDKKKPVQPETYEQVPVDEANDKEGSAEDLIASIDKELRDLGIDEGIEDKSEVEDQQDDQLIETTKTEDDKMPENDYDTIEDDLLSSELFDDDEAEAEATKKIEKFYTLYRKNEEFQKLLDEEYKKLQGGNYPEDMNELVAADERFDVYADTSSVAKSKSDDSHEEILKEDSKEDIENGIKEEIVPDKEKASNVDENKKDEEHGSTALTVVAIVIAVLLVILLVMILIINFAPNSGIGRGLSNMVGNFTSLFGDAEDNSGILL